MRRHHRKKAHHPRHHKVPLGKAVFKEFDNTKDIDRILLKRKLFYDFLGFSGERLAKLFETAIMLLQQNRFDEAVKGFEFLTHLNPYVSDFWLGLGIAKHALEEYKEALSFLFVAQTMDPARSEPYLYAIDCCLDMNNLLQADKILHQGLRYAKRHPSREDSKILLQELPLKAEEIQARLERQR